MDFSELLIDSFGNLSEDEWMRGLLEVFCFVEETVLVWDTICEVVDCKFPDEFNDCMVTLWVSFSFSTLVLLAICDPDTIDEVVDEVCGECMTLLLRGPSKDSFHKKY